MENSNMAHLSDEDLVASVIEDQDLFSALINRYQNKLYRYVLSSVFDEEKAKDIVQETFIKIFINLKGFDQSRKFSSWAYRIAHNEMISHIRKHKKEIKVDDEFLNDLPAEDDSLVEKLDKKIQASTLLRLVDELPEKYRVILVLYYFESKDYNEIAEILNISVSAVGTRLKRGRAKLEVLIKNEKGLKQ